MSTQKENVVCPTCGEKGTWNADNPSRPFCSHRCKLIDLGAWAEEKHRIPDDSNESESIHDADEDE